MISSTRNYAENVGKSLKNGWKQSLIPKYPVLHPEIKPWYAKKYVKVLSPRIDLPDLLTLFHNPCPRLRAP